MGTAREFFEGVRAAQRLIDGALARLEAMRSREGIRSQRYDAIGGGGGVRDAMAPIDARMDAEARVMSQIRSYEAEVARGRRVCEGVRAACPAHASGGCLPDVNAVRNGADVLELRYVEGQTWREVASALGVSVRLAQSWSDAALDWVDLVGLAAAEGGMGQAQLL